jgi:hypothetical protein
MGDLGGRKRLRVTQKTSLGEVSESVILTEN